MAVNPIPELDLELLYFNTVIVARQDVLPTSDNNDFASQIQKVFLRAETIEEHRRTTKILVSRRGRLHSS